ncbi:MAG: carboxypeptidase-like regulatory domain-containing protein, partial [Verrucomicrobiales bacterium]
NFGAYTDMTMNFTQTKAYLTQGSTVVRTSEGKGQAESITTGASLFTGTAGCDMCERFGEEYLFVADRAGDRILRIPVADMPIDVPSDPFDYQALLAKYTAFSGVVRPTALRVIENGRGLIFSADDGFHYERFGFSGRAEDHYGNPMVGAHVTLQSTHGVQSSTTDRDGNYFFRGNFDSGSAILHVNHPSRSYTERVTVNFNCGSEVRPEPLVLIDDVLGEEVTAGNKEFETSDATLDVLGDVLPTPVEFHQTGGILEVTRPDAELEQYDLDFTGDGNEWRVLGIPLMEGDSHLVVRINAAGIYEPGSSERFRVRRNP